eukprot:936121-Pyramimonas_sp.AAC.1
MSREWMISRLAMLHGRGKWTEHRDTCILALPVKYRKQLTRMNMGGPPRGHTAWDWCLCDLFGCE